MSRSEPVTSYDQVIESVRAFNEGLEEFAADAGEELATLLGYFRAWYYIPELDMVGPSKFIGYEDMTAAKYMEAQDTDGRVTEPILSRWFDVLPKRSDEARSVEDKVTELLREHGKTPSRAARYGAPRKWSLPRTLPSSGREGVDPQDVSHAQPILQVFYQAFLSLDGDAQREFLELLESTRDR